MTRKKSGSSSAIAAVAGLVVMVWGARPAAALTNVSTTPFNLNIPGETYVLTTNLNASGTALTITANNVVLNLNGKTITGRGTGFGIVVGNAAGVRVIGPGIVQGFAIGVGFIGTSLSLVQDVEVRDTAAGIVLSSGATDDTVQRVQSHDNDLVGIWVAFIDESADRNVVLGNWCFNNGEDGIVVETNANRIGGNLVTDNGEEGILVFGDNNELLSNRCRANDIDGIGLVPGANANRVRLNICTGNGFDGISLLGQVTSTLIEANTCRDNEEVGISLIEGGNTNNTLRGNTCSENGLLGIASSGDNSANLIELNTCDSNFLDGILLFEGDNNNTLRGNIARNNLFFGVQIDTGATGNTITGNAATINGVLDLLDDNAGPACANAWSGNSFRTKGGAGAACIK
jgi:parallel beta-helix repeat protein